MLRSARENVPSFARSDATYCSTPSRCLISGLLSSSRITTSATNMSAQTGSAASIHWVNEIRSPVASSIRPRPIRFGGLPTGVSSPPTLAPYASISISATPTRSRVGSKPSWTTPRSRMRLAITARMPSAVGSSIATVAVLETKADSPQVIAPNATITRVVVFPTPGSDRIRNANRRARPWVSIACASTKAPMKVKTVEEPNGPSTSSAGATPSSTTAATPSSPPTGIGTASLIHSTMTPSSTPASVCCCGSMSSGRARNTSATSGARNSPTVRRPRSNRSSAGDSCCSPRLR